VVKHNKQGFAELSTQTARVTIINHRGGRVQLLGAKEPFLLLMERYEPQCSFFRWQTSFYAQSYWESRGNKRVRA
jgi:hypothetical protein